MGEGEPLDRPARIRIGRAVAALTREKSVIERAMPARRSRLTGHGLLAALVCVALLVLGVGAGGVLHVLPTAAVATTTTVDPTNYVYDSPAQHSAAHLGATHGRMLSGPQPAGQQPSRLGQARPRSPAALAAEGADAAVTTGARDAAESCLFPNSFTADTPVLTADGKEEPIADVKIGDKVLATDPETGRTEARPVTALIRHSGKHTMVDSTLADGTVLEATDHHPIWDATTRTFTDAINLHVGDQVLSDRGESLTIRAEHVYDRDLTAYNLQIDGIHTYYAGTTPVLVHNSCGPGSEFEVKTRANPGSDGGISHHLIEKVDGQTVSVTHQVEVDGEIVHQHQRYAGVSGDQRYFPSEWSQFPDINYNGGW